MITDVRYTRTLQPAHATMNYHRKIILILVSFTAAASALAGESLEDRVARLEARMKQLEERLASVNVSPPQTAKRPGSQFIGKWRLLNRVEREMPLTLEISRNGEQYLMTSPGAAPQGAAYRDGMLVLPFGSITYIESSGHLTYFEAEYVLQR